MNWDRIGPPPPPTMLTDNEIEATMTPAEREWWTQRILQALEVPPWVAGYGKRPGRLGRAWWRVKVWWRR